MTRTISSGFRDFAEASEGQDVIVLFATITHPALLEPITVNSDIADYILGGVTYLGVAFSLVMLTDDDNPPRASVAIQNVDQAIGEAVLALTSSPSIKIEIYLKSDFDNSTPRNPIGTPSPEYVAQSLLLQNVKCDAMTLTADLMGFDLTTEPWPAIRSTQERVPGIYR